MTTEAATEHLQEAFDLYCDEHWNVIAAPSEAFVEQFAAWVRSELGLSPLPVLGVRS